MNADRLTDYALWGMTAQGDSFEFMADIRVDEIEERVSIPNVFFCFCFILKMTMIINQCYGWTTITLFFCPPPFQSSQLWVQIVVIMLCVFYVGNKRYCFVLYYVLHANG